MNPIFVTVSIVLCQFAVYEECAGKRQFSSTLPKGLLIKEATGAGDAGLKRLLVSTALEDCNDIKSENPSAPSGVYTIKLMYGACEEMMGNAYSDGTCYMRVYCDMQTFGGGWTVFQKRFDGSVDFNKNWREYEVGFGNLSSEFWAGNRFLFHFTHRKTYELHVDLKYSRTCSVYARYSSFRLTDTANYTLSVGSYTGGTTGDSFQGYSRQRLNGMAFSTYDRDNDKHPSVNCAKYMTNNGYTGAWWYRSCGNCWLNPPNRNNIRWHTTGSGSPCSGQRLFSGSEMKLRPKP